ncbi:MAG: DNA polymerase IV [Clostridiales bacterium]|nr:DNA polymerase IV [Clostridiales bacterium]MDY4171611.1 DNA polymerase IV [Evtepia sp.]
MDRVIFHCDLNSFYASVELLSYPELKGKPVAVCGDPTARHGIILAKNEAAKARGVKTAETIWQAQRKCPGLILLPAHHEKYRYYSQLAGEIYRRYTDLVEPFGIDESWLDVTGTLHLFGNDPVALAHRLREDMKRELGLTISVGVSFNKIFAKLGSDYKKPDATTVIRREDVAGLVWPLPVTDLLFVGRASAKLLAAHGITTIGDLAATPRENLVHLLGKNGGQLHDYATGEEHSPVRPAGETPPPKSVGNGLTFRRDLVGEEEIRAGAQMLVERVALRLRKHQMKCTTVQVALRSPEFKTVSRQKAAPAPTNVSRVILACVMELVQSAWSWSAPLRAMTITAAGLLPEEEAGEQMNLFAPQAAERRERQEKLERTMDQLQDRYGKNVIGYAWRRTQTAREITGDQEKKEETP